MLDKAEPESLSARKQMLPSQKKMRFLHQSAKHLVKKKKKAKKKKIS
jgi:hypothetical protein